MEEEVWQSKDWRLREGRAVQRKGRSTLRTLVSCSKTRDQRTELLRERVLAIREEQACME
jgi:hypothetical protein